MTYDTSNKQGRFKHPQARLFSKQVWQNALNRQLHAYEISLMKSSWKKIKSKEYSQYNNSQKERIFICLCESHKKVAAYDLFLFAIQQLKIDHYRCFFVAAMMGNLELLKQVGLLATINTDPERFKYYYSSCFIPALQNDYLKVMRWLYQINPDEFYLSLSRSEFKALDYARKQNNHQQLNLFFKFPKCFSYAVEHWSPQDIEHFIVPLVNNKIKRLQHRISPDLDKSPKNQGLRSKLFSRIVGVVSDLLVDPNEVVAPAHKPIFKSTQEKKVYIEILKFIENSEHSRLSDYLPFLRQQLPSNEHRQRFFQPESESRSPRDYNNASSQRQLIRALNMARPEPPRDYFTPPLYAAARSWHLTNRTDSPELWDNPESSMVPLDRHQKRRLDVTIDYYKDAIESEGKDKIVKKLHRHLGKKYLLDPAKVKIGNEEIILPLDWESFEKLNLEKKYRDVALKAYYKHTIHTAWRYLLKPNPWIHPKANYIALNPLNPEQKWADNQEHYFYIALFWIAAKDKKRPPIWGESVHSRTEFFYNELAMLARAHNWDRLFYRKDAEGQLIEEQRDDLDKDRPSCAGGVLHRLFLTGVDHPLLMQLTWNEMSLEFKRFYKLYFDTLLENETNEQTLIEAYTRYKENPSMENAIVLKEFDLPGDQRYALVAQLKNKYGEQFSHNVDLLKDLNKAYSLTDDPKNPGNSAHVLKFAEYLGLDQFLQSRNNSIGKQSIR